MMYLSSEFKSLHLADLDAQALEMPYKGDRLSMIFILPQNGLAKTEAALVKFYTWKKIVLIIFAKFLLTPKSFYMLQLKTIFDFELANLRL